MYTSAQVDGVSIRQTFAVKIGPLNLIRRKPFPNFSHFCCEWLLACQGGTLTLSIISTRYRRHSAQALSILMLSFQVMLRNTTHRKRKRGCRVTTYLTQCRILISTTRSYLNKLTTLSTAYFVEPLEEHIEKERRTESANQVSKYSSPLPQYRGFLTFGTFRAVKTLR